MTGSDFEDVRRIEVNGRPLAYRDLGAGDPLVLVHGTLSDMRTWAHLAGDLSGDYRVIAYSRRYAPPNDDIEPGVDDHMDPHVDDLIALIGQLGLTPTHLIGDSWGGFISLLAAIRRPELVRSLVLQEPPVLSLYVSSAPRPQQLLPLLLRRPRTAAAIVRFGAGVVSPGERAFDRGGEEEGFLTFAHGVLGRDVFESLPEARRQQAWDNVSTLRAQLPAGFPALSDDDVRGVGVPALLVGGERSPALFHRLSDRLEELLPAAERVQIAGASHAMHEQRPGAVAAATRRFLNAVGGAGWGPGSSGYARSRRGA